MQDDEDAMEQFSSHHEDVNIDNHKEVFEAVLRKVHVIETKLRRAATSFTKQDFPFCVSVLLNKIGSR